MNLGRWLIFFLLAAVIARAADEPPEIPVGLDAYRQWEKWPQQRIGARAYMRSTYDRRGGNEGADASHFLYQLAADNNVALDVEGPPGALYFVRTNHWHGSPWRYVIDGTEHIIQESTTADPLHRVANSVFLPKEVLPNPLTWTWSITKGADLMWVPMPFEKTLRLGYSRTRYGTGYYIYHHYLPGAKLSQPLHTWDGKTPPGQDALDLINKAGADIAPPGAPPDAPIFALPEHLRTLALPAGGAVTVGKFSEAAMEIRALKISIPEATAPLMSKVNLRITWDARATPSIDAPLPMFFGAGTLYNRDNKEHLVNAFPMNISFAGGRVYMACYFPMPFFESAKIELVNNSGQQIADIGTIVRLGFLRAPPNHLAYFHATYRDHPQPKRGHDMVLLNTRETEGGGDWTGSFVGTSFIFSHNANLGTLEGDPRFFFDDSRTPQAQGTGTEEWGGGGDYWGGNTMTLAFAGHPTGAKDVKSAKNDEDKIESAYRFLLADLMPFGRNARIQLEHGGTNESTEHYETVTYWYGLPGASLVKSDFLQIGDPESEHAHAYVSPDASAPEEIKSRYELGPDHSGGVEIFPEELDRGRHTKTQSEFTVKLDPKNIGAMLRRKLDYAFPNQRAEVFVADVSDPAKAPKDSDFKPAGIWYLAGSNTCVYSNPPGELDPPTHTVQTSNRRFRDDEFLVPRDLTKGRTAIRVRVKFTPVPIPLFPGHPLADLAWSEIHYSAYSYVMPPSPLKP
ncbi:MAG TPA: DUF2961 domain-containing protein [Planctomycetota bacterium]|nr:DUF2961 domain-containing protein [Planctomycetota bacterium]